MECIKNVCGLSIIEGYEEYGEFNLRKYQAQCVETGPGVGPLAPPVTATASLTTTTTTTATAAIAAAVVSAPVSVAKAVVAAVSDDTATEKGAL